MLELSIKEIYQNLLDELSSMYLEYWCNIIRGDSLEYIIGVKIKFLEC